VQGLKGSEDEGGQQKVVYDLPMRGGTMRCLMAELGLPHLGGLQLLGFRVKEEDNSGGVGRHYFLL